MELGRDKGLVHLNNSKLTIVSETCDQRGREGEVCWGVVGSYGAKVRCSGFSSSAKLRTHSEIGPCISLSTSGLQTFGITNAFTALYGVVFFMLQRYSASRR